MGTTDTGTDTPPSEAEGSSSDEGGQRSLFGRLFGAFLPRPAPGSARIQTDSQIPSAPVAPQPGLGALRRMRVEDVAVPKVDVVAVPVDITRDDLVEAFRKHGFSRLPVYKGTLDKPVGLVMLKDFALTYGFGAGNGKFSLRKLLRPVLYAPPSMRLPASVTGAFVALGIALALPAFAFAITPALGPGEPTYLGFLGAYGLLFPVLALLEARGAPRAVTIAVLATGVPCYLLGAWDFRTFLMPLPIVAAIIASRTVNRASVS